MQNSHSYVKSGLEKIKIFLNKSDFFDLIGFFSIKSIYFIFSTFLTIIRNNV